MATIALRDLIEKIQKEKPEVKLYTLTDLDIAGMGIRENVKKPDEISVAQAFNCEPVGLRLEDIETYNLEIEPVRYSNSELSLLEKKHGLGEIGKDLYEFFKKGQRVEINVFTPVRLREYLETRFKELGIEKLKPEEEEVNIFQVDSPRVFYRNALWDTINDYITKTQSSLFDFLREKVKLEGGKAEKKLEELSDDQQKIIYEDILEELKKFPSKNWVAMNGDIIEDIEADHEKIKREYQAEVKRKEKKRKF